MAESRARTEEIGPYSEYATAHERALKERAKGLRGIRIDKIEGRWVIRGVRTEQRDVARRSRDPDWGGPAQRYLERLGKAEYEKQRRQEGKKFKRYSPTEYHRELVRLLGRNDEEGFKSLKMMEGYANALGV